jgi:hypothetical protein
MTGIAALTAAAGHATNYTAIFISVGIPLVVLGSVAVIVVAYYRLQAHRADAVAMAHYRKLAEDAVANQEQLRTELSKLTEKVAAVEQLMRDVG